MEIRQVTDASFQIYGKVITGYDCSELIRAMEQTEVPEDVMYLASVKELEEISVCRQMEKKLYGELPIQVGYCNGHNKKLNALEYHRTSEINVAVSDLVLLIGRQQDIREDQTYDTGLVEAYFVPAGTVLEVYATTLHYAPCHTGESGFRCVVILPKGTNTELEAQEKNEEAKMQGKTVSEDRLLFAKNKWLIGHEEGGLPENAWIGLKGENLTIA